MKLEIKEIVKILLALIISVFVIYYVPVPLNKYVSLIIIPIIWFSKRDYFWLAFFFIIEDYPGGLFSGGAGDDPYRIPIITLVPGISFSLREIYYLVLLLKVLTNKKLKNNFPKIFFFKQLNYLGLLFIVLILVTFLHGLSFDSLRFIAKVFINLTLFYSIFFVLNNEINLSKFLNLILPFSFLAISLQLYDLINKSQIIAIIKPGVSNAIGSGAFNTEGFDNFVERPIELVHILFLAVSGSVYLYITNNKYFSKNYLVIVASLGFLSIMLSGTRGWFLGFSVILLAFISFLSLNGKFSKVFLNMIIGLLIIISIFQISPILKSQFNSAFERLMTVTQVLDEGGIQERSATQRYTERAPKVIKGFSQSTFIFGAAFSQTFLKYQDGHVGYHNLLLNTGIIGVLFFLFFIIKLLEPFYQHTLGNNQKLIYFTTFSSFLALMIVNFGSQTIGFTALNNRTYIQAFTLVLLFQAHIFIKTSNSNVKT